MMSQVKISKVKILTSTPFTAPSDGLLSSLWETKTKDKTGGSDGDLAKRSITVGETDYLRD